MICALLASGRFVPSEHGLAEDDLSCWENLWQFCCAYQARTGHAPGLELVTAHYPDFVFLPGLDVNWAADQLHDASYGRRIRRGITGALGALGEGDYDRVSDEVSTLTKPRRPHQLTGLNALDQANLDSAVKEAMPVPFQPLFDVTGGLGFDELWTIGAFTGHGKSQMLPLYAAVIAEAGWRVCYLSIEMKAQAINKRIRRALARNDRALQLRLNSPDIREQRDAIGELDERVPGKITTLDPSMVKMHTGTVNDATLDHHVVMIDHIGLLQLPDGVRAVDDWRGMAKISNILREINLTTKTAMLNAAQTTRESDRNGLAPPKISDFGGSIAVPQDSDVVITIRNPCPGVLSHECGKNRDSWNARWYTRFDPGKADYTEITREQASNLMLRDQDDRART